MVTYRQTSLQWSLIDVLYFAAIEAVIRRKSWPQLFCWSTTTSYFPHHSYCKREEFLLVEWDNVSLKRFQELSWIKSQCVEGRVEVKHEGYELHNITVLHLNEVTERWNLNRHWKCDFLNYKLTLPALNLSRWASCKMFSHANIWVNLPIQLFSIIADACKTIHIMSKFPHNNSGF